MDTGHNEEDVNKTISERRQIVWSQQMEGPSDEPEVHQWSAVHEEDVWMEEDTGERMEERERCERMIPGAMEMGWRRVRWKY
jgi:hypothetical protein